MLWIIPGAVFTKQNQCYNCLILSADWNDPRWKYYQYTFYTYKVYIIFNIAASLPRFCYNLPVHSPYFYGECLVSRHPSLITLLSYLYYIYILPLSYIYDLREADGFSHK